MNKIKQLAATILMACGMVMSMTSCGKENSEESASDIVGSWLREKEDFVFNGEVIYTEEMDDVAILVFTKDGKMYFENDDERDLNKYFYSPESKEVTLVGSHGMESLPVLSLTQSELVVSENLNAVMGLGDQDDIEYSLIGDVVGVYKGFKIYEYDTNGEDLYCYKKDGKFHLCEEFDDEYFDSLITYFKRIK